MKKIVLSAIAGIIIGIGACLFATKKITPLAPIVTNTTSTEATDSPYSAQIKWGIPIVYTNAQYGFKFVLPESWRGYKIVQAQWATPAEEGYVPGIGNTTFSVTHGPIFVFRNPSWTEDKPYQDIPIMVFTLDQWNGLGTKYAYPWAGGTPEELGRNSQYIFILTPRYDNTGAIPNFVTSSTDEVSKIIESEPLHAF